MNNEELRLEMDVKEIIRNVSMGKPHVVILGAGGSLAAFPKGDRNGKKLPLIYDLIDTVGLGYELDRYGIPYKDRNFEEIYSNLYEDRRYENILEVIQDRIWNYFSELRLPSHPTIYDYLVLSLREKDLIVTFNWDPLLYQACWRNHKRAKLPHIAYLHGNVSVGYCLEDRKKGLIGTNCSICKKQFTASKLLFPIKKKDYNQDPFIKGEWASLKLYLKYAYILTIFGYSAPYSDIEAIKLMKEAWGSPGNRNLEQIEIIDIKSGDVLRDTWKDFIHSHHYDVMDNFYQSVIGLFPRRTCEALWNSTMECRFLEQYPIPTNLGFEELWAWYDPLIQAEKSSSQTK